MLTKPPNPQPGAAPVPELRLEHDALGSAVRVLLGPLDITPLVVRVQTNTTLGRTVTEVVLCVSTAHPAFAALDMQEVPLQ